MATKRLPRPRDPIALAKLVGDIATGQVEDSIDDGKSAAAVELGSMGGQARARALTPERRAEIAKRAVASRGKRSPKNAPSQEKGGVAGSSRQRSARNGST